MMIKGQLKSFLLMLSIFLWYGISPVRAQHLVLDNTNEDYVVTYPLFLIDHNQDLSASQVLNHINFKPAKNPTLSLGAIKAAVWVRSQIINRSDQKNWYIQIKSPPVLQSVQVYKKKSGHLVEIFSTHTNTAKTKDQIGVNNLMIPISIPLNTEAEFYIRASSNNILRLPLSIITLKNAFEQSYLSDLLNGLTFGMLAAFAIYNFFVYLLTKERPYLYYVGHVFFWGLNLFFYNGFLPNFMSSYPWLNSAGTILAIASLMSICFTNSFLETKKNSPFFYKISGLMSFLSIVILCTDIFWPGPHSFILIQYLMYPFFVFWLGAAVWSLKNGYKPALYFLLGFGCLMLGNAIYNLKDLNILPDNLFTRSSMHWGLLMEALVLSFALANRVNFYQKAKDRIELKSIEQKRSFLKELLERQEQEKKRIAMELHDNIGQQLILIKNKSWRLRQQSLPQLKYSVNKSIEHIAEIMGRIRSILHRLRPYQMDLLGLTESINGMIADTFVNYDLEPVQTDDINGLFNTNESMHIFRVNQLLTDLILAHSTSKIIIYSIIRHPSEVCFEFNISLPQMMTSNVFNDINNRLELLNGRISVNNSGLDPLIRISIPYVKSDNLVLNK